MYILYAILILFVVYVIRQKALEDSVRVTVCALVVLFVFLKVLFEII